MVVVVVYVHGQNGRRMAGKGYQEMPELSHRASSFFHMSPLPQSMLSLFPCYSVRVCAQVSPGRAPLVLRGLDLGPCTTKWTAPYLMSAHSAASTQVACNEDGDGVAHTRLPLLLLLWWWSCPNARAGAWERVAALQR